MTLLFVSRDLTGMPSLYISYTCLDAFYTTLLGLLYCLISPMVANNINDY